MRAAGSPHTLLIVSHVVHYRHEGRLWAFGPYAREVELWADLFPRVVIAAPCHDELPPGDNLPFAHANISVEPQAEPPAGSALGRLAQLATMPRLFFGLSKAMHRADAIQVRCPGSLGLIGALLGPLFSRRIVAKYAGQWNGHPGESWTWKLQRRLLSSPWWRGPVLVYGNWPGQPDKVVPVFTSVLTEEQAARAHRAAETNAAAHEAQGCEARAPVHVLFVGRLTKSKNVDVLLSALARVRAQGLAVRATIVGDGPERSALESQVSALGLGDCVRLAGGQAFERVLDFYEEADVLVLASNSEGWGKSLAEGMAFGLVCIGSNIGLMPEILGEGRGIVVPPADAGALAEALAQVAREPEGFVSMRAKAAVWARELTLERLREKFREVLELRWGVKLAAPVEECVAP